MGAILQVNSPFLNETKPGCLGYTGDEILPSDVGIIVNHYKDPYQTTRISWKVSEGFSFLMWVTLASICRQPPRPSRGETLKIAVRMANEAKVPHLSELPG